jgi:hypothetical protein
VSKTHTTPHHIPARAIGRQAERYIKTVEKHLRKVVALQRRDWDTRLLIFLLAYRASTHESTGVTPASVVLGRELWLACDLLFLAPPDNERPTINHAIDLSDHLHDIHYYTRQHLKLASDRIKTRYDRYQECGKMWLYRTSHMKRKSPKLQS